jgi:thiosulfate/3-mercaptopyruvate sulfurtransferase
MSGRNGLISRRNSLIFWARPDLRLFDCTTYLEPAPKAPASPISPCPGGTRSKPGTYPGADFLDLQGEFSDPTPRFAS